MMVVRAHLPALRAHLVQLPLMRQANVQDAALAFVYLQLHVIARATQLADQLVATIVLYYNYAFAYLQTKELKGERERRSKRKIAESS